MSLMFKGATLFNQSIGGWNTSNINNFGDMFNNAIAFNNGQPAGASTAPLNWDTSKATAMWSMFFGATACRPNGKYTISLDMTSYPDGIVTITATQTDVAGNSATASVNVQKDVVPPVVSIDNLITNQYSPRLTGTMNEYHGKGKVLIAGVSGAFFITLLSDNTWYINAGTVPNLADGTYDLTMSGKDGVGNETIKTFPNILTIDTVRPNVTIEQTIGQSDPTTTDSAKFTMILSEPLMSPILLLDIFTIEGTTGDISSITQVSDTEYLIEITGMSDNDSVSLSLDENKIRDLAGNYNEASTSEDNTVTYKKPIIQPPVEPEVTNPPTPQSPPSPPSITTTQPSPIRRYESILKQKIQEEKVEESKEPKKEKKTPVFATRNLRVKVQDNRENPLENVNIELHSDVVKGITDKNGEVFFENVKTGKHKLIVSYKDQRIEREVNLKDNLEEEMVINIKIENAGIPCYVYWLIAVIILLLVILGYTKYKKEKRKNK